MSRLLSVLACIAAATTLHVSPVHAQKKPIYETTKVDGTDGVYTFRYQNSLSMFIVTPAGVSATDPIGYGRPQAVVTYLEEIRKITDKPIKYVLYSHHHFDHIAGGKPFKDRCAIAKELQRLVAPALLHQHLAELEARQRQVDLQRRVAAVDRQCILAVPSSGLHVRAVARRVVVVGQLEHPLAPDHVILGYPLDAIMAVVGDVSAYLVLLAAAILDLGVLGGAVAGSVRRHTSGCKKRLPLA